MNRALHADVIDVGGFFIPYVNAPAELSRWNYVNFRVQDDGIAASEQLDKEVAKDGGGTTFGKAFVSISNHVTPQHEALI